MSANVMIDLSSLILVVTAMMSLPDNATGARARAAAASAHCPLDRNGPFDAALASFPGQGDASLNVIATLSGAADSGGLGSLCVAIVKENDSRFSPIATLSPQDRPQPPYDVDPVTNRYVSIDNMPFRFMPGETAIGVRVTGEFNSTSTNSSWSTLYLIRRQGGRLRLIFHAMIDQETIDKTSDGADRHTAFFVRFDRAQHRGAYDLLIGKSRDPHPRRFIWNGTRYISSGARGRPPTRKSTATVSGTISGRRRQ